MKEFEIDLDTELSEDKAKYIPLRLNHEERLLLRVIEGALDVSEYTDVVDVSSNNYYARSTYDTATKMMNELTNLFQLIVGLGFTNNVNKNSFNFDQDDVMKNAPFVARCFEIARRYKIMNPDKMRSTYGKLLYIMMDCEHPRIRRQTGVSLKRRIKTVYTILESTGCLSMLQDVDFRKSVNPVISSSTKTVSSQLLEREQAIKKVIEKYANVSKPVSDAVDSESKMEVDGEVTSTNSDSESDEDDLPSVLTEETIRLIVDSVLDNFSFLETNLLPVIKLIEYLNANFDPTSIDVTNGSQVDLGIRSGVGGSMLTHGHTTQFNFVLQSLTLWKNILSQFFKAWTMAEKDLLLPGNGYSLTNTGQGLQRCQSAPNAGKLMSQILSVTKSEIKKQSQTYAKVEATTKYKYAKEWVGLSVVHLGDRDVPNAFIFIDKYTQVSRMLVPLVQIVDKIGQMSKNTYVNKEFGGPRNLQVEILGDFFRHGFDGSGDDGGSCIDGRLTSSWNWCSKLEKKRYYPVFLLTGFLGFDGSFRE